MRNISFALTTPQFLDGSKTVTRRLGWKHAKASDVLCAIEKGQGLKKGETVKRLGLIRIVSARREPLYSIFLRDVAKEGFPDWSRDQFICFFCEANKCEPGTEITRIEFERIADTPDRSLDEAAGR